MRKVGEQHLTDKMRDFHLNNADSTIVFLKEDERVFIHIASLCPFEIGINGATGFRYDAIKDFIRWNGNSDYEPDELYKEHISTFLQLGIFMSTELKPKSNRK